MRSVPIDRRVVRAAVTLWRDDAALGAMALVYQGCAAAMQAFEDRLDGVAIGEAAVDAAGVAGAIVRPLALAAVAPAADAWFTNQARALRRIDARLEALALRFAALGERPPLPADRTTAAAAWSVPAWLRAPAEAIGSAIGYAADGLASRALPVAVRDGATEVSGWIGREIGARSGVHERLRAAARDDLSRTWTGPAPSDAAERPYLAQLLAIVERTATQALEEFS